MNHERHEEHETVIVSVIVGIVAVRDLLEYQ